MTGGEEGKGGLPGLDGVAQLEHSGTCWNTRACWACATYMSHHHCPHRPRLPRLPRPPQDEPSTGLDPASRRNLWEVVRSNKVGTGRAAVQRAREGCG